MNENNISPSLWGYDSLVDFNPPELRDFVACGREIDCDPDTLFGGILGNPDGIDTGTIETIIRNHLWFFTEDSYGPQTLWLARLPGGSLVRVDQGLETERGAPEWQVRIITIDEAVQIMNPAENPTPEDLARYDELVPGLGEAVRRWDAFGKLAYERRLVAPIAVAADAVPEESPPPNDDSGFTARETLDILDNRWLARYSEPDFDCTIATTIDGTLILVKISDQEPTFSKITIEQAGRFIARAHVDSLNLELHHDNIATVPNLDVAIGTSAMFIAVTGAVATTEVI